MNTRSLESANETEISTIVAICVVIAVVIFVGLIIYLCCKGLQHKRRSHDIEDQRRPPDMNSPPVAIVSYNVNQSDEIQSTNSTEVVVGNELLKVTNPENEESDTTDLILSTRVQRMAPHSRVQRGYESEIKVYEEETMRESVKSASITLGEMSEDTVTVVHHYQETDKYSNAYCFSTMVRELRKI